MELNENFSRLWIDDTHIQGDEFIIYGIEDEKGLTAFYEVMGYRNWTMKILKQYAHKIEEIDKNFINGFKRVKVGFLKMAFLREMDGKLMPYYFDLVSTFNDRGFAMASIGTNLAWIDNEFRIYGANGECLPLYQNSLVFPELVGFSELNNNNVPDVKNDDLRFTIQKK